MKRHGSSLVLASAAVLVLTCAETFAEPQPTANRQPRFTQPPRSETEAVKQRIDQVSERLAAGDSSTAILTDASLLDLHEWPRFRQLIRKGARSSTGTIVTHTEPGQPLVVSGRVLTAGNQPESKALVYVYQTSARGWYSDRAAHFAANEGDRKHARLFGYLKTDAEGRFELRSIRPGGYPNADLPCHIHVEVSGANQERIGLVTEIQFDDDPRLTAAWRKRSQQEGFVIAAVKKDPDGVERVQVELRLR